MVISHRKLGCCIHSKNLRVCWLMSLTDYHCALWCHTLNNCTLKNHIKKTGFLENAFCSHRSDSFFSDSYGYWNHPLASSFNDKKDMLTVDIFQDWTSKNTISWAYVNSGRFPTILPVTIQEKKHVVIFNFNRLSVTLLWFSWIINIP